MLFSELEARLRHGRCVTVGGVLVATVSVLDSSSGIEQLVTFRRSWGAAVRTLLSCVAFVTSAAFFGSLRLEKIPMGGAATVKPVVYCNQAKKPQCFRSLAGGIKVIKAELMRRVQSTRILIAASWSSTLRLGG